MPSKKTNDEFVKELMDIAPTITPLEKYINARTKILCKCMVCGNNFSSTPDNLLHGKGCPVCAVVKRGIKRRKSNEQFLKEMEEKHPELIVNTEYKSSFEKVNCTCTICGRNFDAIPANLTYGTGCPECGNRKIGEKLSKSLEQFEEDLYKINPNITIVGPYTKQSAHIHVKCNICGHEWEPFGTSLLAGVGCPICRMSHGERRVDLYLHNSGIKHEHQKEYNGLVGISGGNLSYDFLLLDNNILIEYQGEYHDGTALIQTKEEFEKQQIHDKLKKQYAQENNISLLEIWYWDYDNIEEILDKYLN